MGRFVRMPPPDVPPSSAPARVVIADDHEALVHACKALIARDHVVVATVGTGRAALEAVAEHDPDVLLLDLDMPDTTGLEVLQELARRSVRTAVVILTLYQEAWISERAFALGALGFVTKSRMARDLRPALRAVLVGDRFCSSLTP